MSSPRHCRFVAFVALASLAVACSDSSTSPSSVQPVDLGQVLAELQPSSLAGITAQLSPAPVAGLNAPVPSSCSYDGVARSFVCPSVSVTGLTVSRSFALYDASDNPQTAFDRTTTAAARMTTSLAGTVASGGTTLAIEEQQDMKVSGLLTGVHTLNGSSLIHVNGTVATGATTTPIVSTAAITISNLAVPRESTGPNRFPASGSVTALTEATYGALPKMTVGTTITFNGTSRAAVTVNVNGLTTHCTVDLSSATVALCTT